MKRSMKAIAIAALAGLFLGARSARAEEVEHKSPLLAAGLNFFVPGAGYLYNGKKPLYVSLPLIAGAVGLTYLEQFHEYGDSGETLRDHDSTGFAVLFSTVFVINTALAIDAYREARAINHGEDKRWTVGLGPAPGGGYQLGLATRF